MNSEKPLRLRAVTAVRNGESLVADTISSILSQGAILDGTVELDYVIHDGKSADRTLAIAKNIAGSRATVVSESDTGLYDALRRRFEETPAEVDYVFYLNAGDVLMPNALQLVHDLSRRTRVSWISGMPTLSAASGQLISSRLPPRIRPDWVVKGVYGTILPHLQQESQFWSARLLRLVDLDRFGSFRLAGDSFLWNSFARVAAPTLVQAALGSFRLHGGHLGSDSAKYRAELASFSDRIGINTRIMASLERPLWNAPDRVKRKLNKGIVYFDSRLGGWRGGLIDG